MHAVFADAKTDFVFNKIFAAAPGAARHRSLRGGLRVSGLSRGAVAEEHLATYGPWDVATFGEQVPNERVSLVVLSVRDRPGRRGASSRVGDIVRGLWSRFLDVVPAAAGHRASWGELWFLVPGASAAALLPGLSVITELRPLDPDLEVWCAIAAAGEGGSRLHPLDDLACGLAKVRYRNALPEGLCLLDGKVLDGPPEATPDR